MPTDPNRDWTDHELSAAVEAYLQMLEAEQSGKQYVKSDINDGLRQKGGPLSRRTKAAVEYRMQNISAILRDEGKPFVPGYAPAKNVGNRVRMRIWEMIKDRLDGGDRKSD